MNRTEDFSARDALGEAGNIGAGRAATAMEFLTGEPISLSPPRVGEGVRPIGAVEIGLELEGRLCGEVFITLDPACVAFLLLRLRGVSDGDLTRLGEMERSVICEAANVLGCTYLTAISELTHLTFHPTVPTLRIGGKPADARGSVWIGSRMRGRDGFEAELVLDLEEEGHKTLLNALGVA